MLRARDLPRELQQRLFGKEEVPAKKPSRSALANEEFALQCRMAGLPPFMSKPNECHFAKAFNGRLWRFDFAWPEFKVAVEIEGLAVTRLEGRLVVLGRHASIDGFREDCEKYNTAALLGWSVLRFEQKLVKPGKALEFTLRMLTARGFKTPPKIEPKTNARATDF